MGPRGLFATSLSTSSGFPTTFAPEVGNLGGCCSVLEAGRHSAQYCGTIHPTSYRELEKLKGQTIIKVVSSGKGQEMAAGVKRGRACF